MLITLSRENEVFQSKKAWQVQQAVIAIVFIYYTSVLVRSCAARFL